MVSTGFHLQFYSLMFWRKNCLVIECLAQANVTEAMTALMGPTNSTVPQVEVANIHFTYKNRALL
jgi:hypothetical protein